MSQSSSVHDYVDARFRDAFGEPYVSRASDDHWHFARSSSQLPINVLLNGMREFPVPWIFDSNDAVHGVFRTALTDKQQVDNVIEQIRERVRRGARSIGCAPTVG